MADIVPPSVRSRMMSGIRGKDTKPELIVRRAVYAAGYRYRLHDHRFPGHPDLVIGRIHVAIFVHGCFWHAHRDCRYFKMPASNKAFWARKFRINRHHDQAVTQILLSEGWRVIVVWECALKRSAKTRATIVRLLGAIKGNRRFTTID